MDHYEYGELLKTLKTKMQNIEGVVQPDTLRTRLGEIEQLENSQDFWNDAANAAAVQKEKTQLERKLEKYETAATTLLDAADLYDMAKEENDDETVHSLFDEADKLAENVRAMEIQVLLSGPNDSNNAIVSIHPGAGGTESQDWASILLRMYSRWAERHGFSVETLDHQVGEEAGIKDASIIIKGENAYGYLKVENGIHRLVRISPFDSASRRHTSFVALDVTAELDDDIDVEIAESDLRIDTYRAQGAGGQHVNTTDSAVRIVHLPTGIVVQCQAERSQHKNKAKALKVLKARVYEYEMDKQKQAAEQFYGAKGEIAWGSQIRSYVMQPYTMVNDHRTDKKVGNVQAVIDGEIDPFIEAYLKMKQKEAAS